MPPLIKAKHIVEFRYPAASIFHDKRGIVCSSFQEEPFVHWQIGPVRVDLHSEDKRYSAFVTSKNAGLTIELAESNGEFLRHLRRYSRLIHGQLNLTSLTRIGMRMLLLIPQDSFESAASIFMETIYSPVSEQISQLGDANDYSCMWNLTIGEREAHFQIGPMEVKQLRENFIQGDIDEEQLPESFIFVDFDIYAENPNFSIRTDRFITQFAESSLEDIVSRTRGFLESFEMEIGE